MEDGRSEASPARNCASAPRRLSPSPEGAPQARCPLGHSPRPPQTRGWGGEQDGVEERKLENEQKVGEEVEEPKDDHHPSPLWGRSSHVFLFGGGGLTQGDCLCLFGLLRWNRLINRNVLLTVLEAGSMRSGCQLSRVLVRAHFLVECCLHTVTSLGRGVRGLCLKVINPIHKRSTHRV